MYSPLDLKDIASRGGGMILDASKISPLDLKDIASRASNGGGLIVLRNCHGLSPLDAKDIASRSKGRVILDLI